MKRLLKAIMNEDLDAVKVLLKYAVKLSIGEYMRCVDNALYYGKNDILSELLKDEKSEHIFSDKYIINSMYISYVRNHEDTVNILLNDDRIITNYNMIEKTKIDNQFRNYCLNKMDNKIRLNKLKTIIHEF